VEKPSRAGGRRGDARPEDDRARGARGVNWSSRPSPFAMSASSLHPSLRLELRRAADIRDGMTTTSSFMSTFRRARRWSGPYYGLRWCSWLPPVCMHLRVVFLPRAKGRSRLALPLPPRDKPSRARREVTTLRRAGGLENDGFRGALPCSRAGSEARIGLQRHDQMTSEQDPLGALTALVAAVALQRAIDSGERLEAEDRFAARGRCEARARRMERRPLSRSRVSNLAKAAATWRCSSRIAWSSPITGSRSR